MHPIKNPQFRLLLATRLSANLSAGFFEVAVIWWVFETTGSGALIAAIALVGSLSYILVAPWGGVLADHYSKKSLITLMYWIDGALTAAAGLLLMLGQLHLALIFLLLAITNTATALRAPALGALLPLILPKESYQQGNATMGLAVSLAGMSSFPLAGVATAALGAGGALLVGAGLILVAGLFMAFLQEPRLAPATEQAASEQATGPVKTAPVASFREGVQAVLQNSLLLSVVVTVAVLNLILAPLTVLLAPYAALLTAGAAGFGFLAGAAVLGQLLGLSLANFWKVSRPLAVIVPGTVGVGLSLAGLYLAPSLPVAIAALAFGGLCAALMNVQLEVILQTNVKPELLGRAYGLLTSMGMAAQPAGYAAAGGLMAIWPIRAIFGGMAVLVFLMTAAWLRPAVRQQLSARTVEAP
jgi:DHA3 family macrolide efflux protein-like MFS transporter